MSFIEAAEMLGQMCNLDLPTRSGKGQAKSLKKPMLEMHNIAVKFYADFIRSDNAKHFRTYLKERNIVKSIVVDFNIGASPDSWDTC